MIEHGDAEHFEKPSENFAEDCDGALDLPLPFLHRNLKRKFKNSFKSNASLIQSIASPKQSFILKSSHDVCSPELTMPLNAPSRNTPSSEQQRWKTTGSIDRLRSDRRQYRVHTLRKEKNGKIYTTTTSFCFSAFRCPLCTAFDGIDLKSLWTHCAVIHGEQYVFYPMETNDGMFHLLIEQPCQPEMNDGISQASIISLSARKEIPSFEEVFRSGVSLPVRHYYHDVTFDTIGLSEWLFNLKDDEYDPTWRTIVDTSALFDMTDVSMREKHFMSHWNNFMRSHPIVSEIQLSSQVESFVRENSSVIFESKLEGELMAHLTNMWVEGHIGQWTMLEIMKGYDSYVKQRSK